jgi:hypothetical protein
MCGKCAILVRLRLAAGRVRTWRRSLRPLPAGHRASVRSSPVHAGGFSPGSVLPDPGGQGVPAGAAASSDCRLWVRRADRAAYSLASMASIAAAAVSAAWRTSGCAWVSSRSAHRASATPRIPIWSCRTVMGSVITYSDRASASVKRRRPPSRRAGPAAPASAPPGRPAFGAARTSRPRPCSPGSNRAVPRRRSRP